MHICNNLQTLLSLCKVHGPVVFIKAIKLDSRHIFPGDLFIALYGYQFDGRNYIMDAIRNGAHAVISESDGKFDHGYIYYIDNIPIINLNNIKYYLSLISGKFYNYPSLSLNLVGITGTNGKTTVAHLLFQWVNLLSEKSAVMGTIGNGMVNGLSYSVNTTSSPVEIQKMLAYFLQKGVTFVSMEVSSHGLVQNRVRDLYFRAAVFTNLSHDHLDYHGDIKSYEAAKWILFSELDVKEYIINADDIIGFRWLLKLNQGTAVTWRRKLPRNWSGKWLHIISVNNVSGGFDVVFDSVWGYGVIHSQLIGAYNVSNLLLALATLLTLNYPLSILLDTAPYLKSICGRMEVFRSAGYPTVVVDYAHNPEALRNVLLEIRAHCFGKIWCVFGCGGGRDATKRPIMGNIAERYSDCVIITDDNPRTEESKKIISDIKSGFVDINSGRIQIIQQREEALRAAVFQATSKDWVLVAGKGHENYQIIGNSKIIYSDQVIIKNLLSIVT
ncbi:UDP-N-acetylmuramoyl-L-alanyl-D-glutamate--2,6-diaminopimelate ligase [Blochmannia endosymbiont of Polyrhachis (Hedomyrma) turneri]|uniref:UDP-N-acetylmuramoyl-L-alanyl-D-glutamate--2, 6-diaminopimelate ligase n=1 Tax=Blochmannia endosymbiont of Polyrhachis (Hedomyrma) turneri TaxID=1505596 RepID=UPI00061A87DC|nr:UDP-N-acetylmuramoyl-L-alanyl-D-glutamate--2,6-diaminopimelate ligase [Blochmannia endosymbiont of Polyrhachis (Hedomyrma) turneri]AKC59720.1 UDP-N-acetylmuramoyl-L-alanyl-D-glutamate--2,6-diaminopimelate ligase [Blochmannia endosymbiont of Polyrhachis (Hedomyrma) turneri]